MSRPSPRGSGSVVAIDPEDHGVIYVIGETGGPNPSNMVKIGLAATPALMRRRLGSFQTGNPRKLEVLHCEKHAHPRWVEYRLHVALGQWRSGHADRSEWFDVRDQGDGRWADFLAEKLASPAPLPAPTESCEVLHLAGRLPGSLVAVCRCGWKGTPASVVKAIAQAEKHFS